MGWSAGLVSDWLKVFMNYIATNNSYPAKGNEINRLVPLREVRVQGVMFTISGFIKIHMSRTD